MMESLIVRSLLYGAFGGLLGALFFAALGWNVQLYVGGAAPWCAPLVHLLRLLTIASVLTLCARHGFLPLLSSLVGFHGVRTAAVNHQRRALEARL